MVYCVDDLTVLIVVGGGGEGGRGVTIVELVYDVVLTVDVGVG